MINLLNHKQFILFININLFHLTIITIKYFQKIFIYMQHITNVTYKYIFHPLNFLYTRKNRLNITHFHVLIYTKQSRMQINRPSVQSFPTIIRDNRTPQSVFTWRIPRSGTRKVVRVAKVSGRYACVSIIVDIFQ